MNNKAIKTVQFKPTELLDPVKQGGTIRVGKTLEGEMLERKDGSKIVYFEDKNGQEWSFLEGITCKILRK